MWRRINEGLAWRRNIWKRYLFFIRSFRNGFTIARAYRHGWVCDRAVCWNGSVLTHPPGRKGLPETLLEIWHEQVYTGPFYQPAPGDLIVDAGANVGLFAVWIARLQPACRVLAFEPSEENYQLLCQNVERTAISVVTPVRAGLSAHSGFGRMKDGGSRSLDHQLISAGDERDDERIQVLSFGEVLDMCQRAAIDLFKIDIEGSEGDFLSGASDDGLRRVRRFAIEYHDNIRPGTLELLKKRLASTHSVTVVAASDGYGMLYATLKPSAS